MLTDGNRCETVAKSGASDGSGWTDSSSTGLSIIQVMCGTGIKSLLNKNFKFSNHCRTEKAYEAIVLQTLKDRNSLK